MSETTATLRILEPFPGIFAYYDGRIPGRRLHSPSPNWLDDGAYALGIASYAIVDGGEALIYDTHISLAHARFIRAHLAGLGVTAFRVVLSHWHNDHVAGNAVFADGEIIALGLTAKAMADNRQKLEARDPPIAPLVMPSRLFDARLDLTVGTRRVELHHFAIHSADGNVIWLPDDRILLAGDTLEDTITYIAEAKHTATHIGELARLRGWPIRRILPSHGDPARIAAGGYRPSLIDANRHYLTRLAAAVAGADPGIEDLASFIAADIRSGAITYFAPYQAVHGKNITALRAALDQA